MASTSKCTRLYALKIARTPLRAIVILCILLIRQEKSEFIQRAGYHGNKGRMFFFPQCQIEILMCRGKKIWLFTIRRSMRAGNSCQNSITCQLKVILFDIDILTRINALGPLATNSICQPCQTNFDPPTTFRNYWNFKDIVTIKNKARNLN